MKVTAVVFTVLVILILCLLFLKINVEIYLSQKGKITVRVLFFKYSQNIYGKSKSTVNKKKKASVKASSDLKKSNKNNFLQNYMNENGIVQTVTLLLETVKNIFVGINDVIKSGKFKELNLNITVSDSDAAITAIAYGGVCALVYPLVGFINNNYNILKQNINVSASYEEEKSKIEFSAKFYVRFIKILKVGIILLFKYFKNK